MVRHKRSLAWLILFLSVAAGGCATKTPKLPPIAVEKGESYLNDICERNNVFWQWDQISQVVILNYRDAQARLLIGSGLVLVGEEKITLDAPVRRAQSAVIVPRDFQGKVIDRMRRKAALPRGYAIRSIMIDPGHGGKDPGAIGVTGTQEKDVVLDIGKRLSTLLKERGFQVEMTRSDDTFISLEGRTQIASRANADLFVSIHANAALARHVYGIEVYAAEDLNLVDKIAAQRKANEDLLFANLKIRRNDPNVRNIVSDMLYTHRQPESRKLANHVADQTSGMVKTKNRGAKMERFYVLRNTLVPAILVEVGFLTNPKEEKLLQTSAYRQRVAQSLAESITDYFNAQ